MRHAEVRRCSKCREMVMQRRGQKELSLAPSSPPPPLRCRPIEVASFFSLASSPTWARIFYTQVLLGGRNGFVFSRRPIFTLAFRFPMVFAKDATYRNGVPLADGAAGCPRPLNFNAERVDSPVFPNATNFCFVFCCLFLQSGTSFRVPTAETKCEFLPVFIHSVRDDGVRARARKKNMKRNVRPVCLARHESESWVARRFSFRSSLGRRASDIRNRATDKSKSCPNSADWRAEPSRPFRYEMARYWFACRKELRLVITQVGQRSPGGQTLHTKHWLLFRSAPRAIFSPKRSQRHLFYSRNPAYFLKELRIKVTVRAFAFSFSRFLLLKPFSTFVSARVTQCSGR